MNMNKHAHVTNIVLFQIAFALHCNKDLFQSLNNFLFPTFFTFRFYLSCDRNSGFIFRLVVKTSLTIANQFITNRFLSVRYFCIAIVSDNKDFIIEWRQIDFLLSIVQCVTIILWLNFQLRTNRCCTKTTVWLNFNDRHRIEL